MEITANAIQTVAPNADVMFTTTPVAGCASILHREGSGLVTLRGLSSKQARARFRVYFGANVAVPVGGTVGPVSFALAMSGEAIPTTTMISTPAADNEYNNISTSVFLDIPTGCCSQIAVKNIGVNAADIQNANLIIERVA